MQVILAKKNLLYINAETGNFVLNRRLLSPSQLDSFPNTFRVKVFIAIFQLPIEFWSDLLHATFSTPRVLLLAYPSEEYDRQLMLNETERVAKQVISLYSS